MRVRGTAYKKVEKEKKLISHEDLKEGLVFFAVLGAIDPPPDEVPRAVKKCKEAGLTVKKIIGDRELMAMRDRKSTRLNSSHARISYAVFCLKKKK